MNNTNPEVDAFFGKAQKWKEEMEQLRRIVLECPFREELKWKQPCYTYQNNNVVIISGFKDYCLLNFIKGALLKDEHSLTNRIGEHTQAARQIRFTSVSQIRELEPLLKAYLYEAIEVEKAGLKVTLKKTEEFKVPEEFQLKLTEFPALKTAFEALTPGRQRAYLLHFSAPKQSSTRKSRIENCIQQILNGKGLND